MKCSNVKAHHATPPLDHVTGDYQRRVQMHPVAPIGRFVQYQWAIPVSSPRLTKHAPFPVRAMRLTRPPMITLVPVSSVDEHTADDNQTAPSDSARHEPVPCAKTLDRPPASGGRSARAPLAPSNA